MKKLIVPFILLSVLFIDVNAQEWYNKYYSNKNLNELNTDELTFLSGQANKTTKTGAVLLIAGASATVIGSLAMISRATRDILEWDYSGDAGYAALTLVTIGGAIMAIVGLPVLITGIHRRNIIKDRPGFPGQDAHLSLSPSLQYNNNQQSYCPGLRLIITF